jgi:hypothetical protein
MVIESFVSIDLFLVGGREALMRQAILEWLVGISFLATFRSLLTKLRTRGIVCRLSVIVVIVIVFASAINLCILSIYFL